MALQQFLCGAAVIILLCSKGCHSQSACGLVNRNTRIVGGRDASPGSYPWQVSLNDEFGLFCGGSLITNKYVLTAAHCVTGSPNFNVFVGRHSQSGPNPNEERRTVDRIISHPDYDFLTNDNDIALLKLSAPVPLTDYIYPVCLAAEDSVIHTGTSSWVAGWGLTDNGTFSNILQEVNVPIVGNNQCDCYIGGITENMICAGLKEGGRDSCEGDSGSALVTNNGPIWVQTGVVSFGFGCGEPESPGVNTRVSQYMDWIIKVIGSRDDPPGFVTLFSSGVDSDLSFECSLFPVIDISSTPSFTPPMSSTTEDNGSVFDSGENLIPFTHFISLPLLLLSFHVFVGEV